ncbi:MAG: TonB-dependent receptor [Acidobacteriota bacterium]
MREKISLLIITIALSFSMVALSAEERSPEEAKKIAFEEKVTVTARLPETEESLEKTPAHVTIITSEEIENSGASSIQELLATQAGIIFFDDVGNNVETTIDLRGFNEGTAAAVLLDGVRINEPDDNRVNLEQIPLSSIERIEIYRGSSSSTFGAGALSGTINIVTKDVPWNNFLDITASYGSNSSSKGSISGGFHAWNSGFFLDIGRETSDGFRENSEYAFSHIFFKAATSMKRAGDFSLSFLHDSGELGAPGSLTAEEMERDRYFSPYNKVDGCDETLDQVTLRMERNLQKKRHFSTNLYFRENSIDTLTTGRWLIGFETNSKMNSSGFISQFDSHHTLWDRDISLASGIEAMTSRFQAKGYFTDAQGERFSSSPDSSSKTSLRRAAAFFQATMNLTRIVSILSGARFDYEHLNYDDRLHPGNEGTTRFSEKSLKAGANINPSEKTGFYVLYSEAFLPPTVYDLFAFPLFGSNPDLDPSRARNYEFGIRKRWGDFLRMNASLFRIDTEDEIVYVMTDPLTFTGRNENVGKSKRIGVEIVSEFSFSGILSGFFSYSQMKAELRSGENRGRSIPLVPEKKILAGFLLKGGKKRDLLFSMSAMHVGREYLTGDESNTMEPLDPYTTVNGRLSKAFKRFTLFLEGKNLLNEKYETRGITNGFDLFYTPSPGRTIYTGAKLSINF